MHLKCDYFGPKVRAYWPLGIAGTKCGFDKNPLIIGIFWMIDPTFSILAPFYINIRIKGIDSEHSQFSCKSTIVQIKIA